MQKQRVFLMPFLFLCASVLLACNKEDGVIDPQEVPDKNQNIDGTRIAWDYSSKVKVAPAAGRTEAYCGYSRLVQLYDGRLACVYETSSGNVELVFSEDIGATWSYPKTIFATRNSINMAVPDIIELNDHSILIACNPRPREPYTDDRKFGIMVRKSIDGGESWHDEQLVYEAQSTFNNGCWEPSFVQLPNGELQLFFANEGTFISSDEQNISMLRSVDNGETWSDAPIVAGFRPGRRDGMPVPLLLEDKGEILVAVEDNKKGEFKPSIYHEKITDNWVNGYISENDSRRDYHPLVDVLSDDIYAGAPYLARLKSGEVLLSYQSTWNRSDIWDRSCMVVEVGNSNGENFKNRSMPFNIPITKWGLWNSVSVIENGTIPVAVTSTNAYSYGSTEVWMVKGHVIPEYSVKNGTATIDGELHDDCWQHEWPYFVGHKGASNMKSSLCMDENYLYVGVEVNNLPSGFENGGTVTFQLDIERKGYEKPHERIYSFICGFDKNLSMKVGSFGTWIDYELPEGIKYQLINNSNTSKIEMAIPVQVIGGNFENELGLNFELSYPTQSSVISESLPNCDSDSPYTWCPVFIK